MKREGLAKHLLIGFSLAVVMYAAGYSIFSWLQKHNGPWRVQFVSNTGGPPHLIVNEAHLGITNATLTFAGQSATSTNVTMVFDQPRDVPFDLPFGQCTFMETISLPGTLRFVMFGHEIQLLPRSLTVDGKPSAWNGITNLEIAK